MEGWNGMEGLKVFRDFHPSFLLATGMDGWKVLKDVALLSDFR